jgi:hypothetical protein
MKVALIQDWLTEQGGAEKVFATLYELYTVILKYL